MPDPHTRKGRVWCHPIEALVPGIRFSKSQSDLTMPPFYRKTMDVEGVLNGCAAKAQFEESETEAERGCYAIFKPERHFCCVAH